MSVTQRRRERERQELRAGILAAAREIAARDGWQAVTVRKVAEAVEYSPPMLYEYFPSKEAILAELLRTGFAELRDALVAARAAAATAEDAVARVAVAYWQFATANPELYQVMHGLGGVPFGTRETAEEARAAFLALRDVVAAVRGGGDGAGDPLDPADPVNADVGVFWGVLHGLVALAMAERLAGGQERGAALTEHAVALLLAAWRAAPLPA